jgi:hypothetical protein
MRRKRDYAVNTLKDCHARGSHHDAEDLAKYLMGTSGKTTKPAVEICEALGWWRRTSSPQPHQGRHQGR